ncbi:Inner membrane metabolite transport protein YhjE [Pigmentiphaga humi]|uniref:Inner membrane metabolite transport protein YhjE n=1 Tax=Pigmentiphaga humi TaxID=2478468 RepID=A0A3P4B1G0_9BURK|nr:MFS transporter [Pigmentiphaga humi]VCU69711.1 Inner membrane metabolite transport protein YhjE [Pigmentiphaga humi]
MSSTVRQYPPGSAHEAGHSDVAPGEIAVGVVIGRASEYFDFFVFGIACVVVFPQVFFPFESPLNGTLWSFVIFSFAFICRPFGTAIFMAVQRRWGRGAKLTMALFMLGTATAGMAFLPSYETLGPAAILLLAIFRCLQGIALGGSWDGLPSLLSLNAPADRRGWYAMLGQLGAPVGFMLAGAIFLYLLSTLASEDLVEWGWRYPFFVAFAINVVALFARLRLVLTEEYTRLLEERELAPIRVSEVIDEQAYNVFIGAFAALASYALFHLVTIFPLSWINLHGERPLASVLTVQIIGAALSFVATIASGWVADHFGRRNTLAALAGLIGLFALSAPWLLGGGTAGENLFILCGFVLLGLSYGQASGTVTSNFSMYFRYTGAALTADIAWLFGAAFAPLVALGLSMKFGLIASSLYLISGAVCTLVALKINRLIETN